MTEQTEHHQKAPRRQPNPGHQPSEPGHPGRAGLSRSPPFLHLLRSPWTALVAAAVLAALLSAFALRPPAVLFTGQRAIGDLLGGFHEREELGGRSFRWTTGEATVRLPAAGLAPPITLILRGAGSPYGSVPLTLRVNGQLVGRLTIRRDPAVYAAVVPEPGDGGTIVLTLNTPTFRPAQDPRDLGIQVEQIALLSWGHPLSNVPWAPLALLGTLLLALYATLLRLTGKPWAAAALTSPGIALAAIGVQRHWPTLPLRLPYWAGLVGAGTLFLLCFAPTLRQDMGRLWRSLRRGRPRAIVGPRDRMVCSSTGLLWTVRLSSLAVLALHGVAFLLPAEAGPWESYAWGVRFFARLPAAIQVFALLLAVSLSLFSTSLAEWVSTLLRRRSHRRINRYLLILCAALGAIPLFWLLRTRCAYGDWQEILNDIAEGAMWRERSPLDFLLRAATGRFLAPRWPGSLRVLDPLTGCLDLPVAAPGLHPTLHAISAAISCLAGGVFVAAVLLLGQWLFRLDRDRWLFGLLVAGQGTLLLFCGYLETYSLVTAALAVYLLLGALALQRRIALLWPAAALIVSVALHLQALYLVPSFLVLLILRFRAERRRWPGWAGGFLSIGGAGLLLVLALASTFLLLGYDTTRLPEVLTDAGGTDGVLFKHLLQVRPNTREPYPILSWNHLRAVLNQHLLTAPLSLLLCTAALSLLGWKAAREDSLLLFFLAAALSALLFSVTYNLDLGPRQDWDLLAPPAVIVTISAAYLLLTRLRPAKLRLAVILPWLAVSLLHAAAWVWVNRLGI